METIDVYEILVREHERMLLAYVLGIVGDFEAAENVVQEAFVRGWRKLSTLRRKESFAPWIRVIARNIAIRSLQGVSREISLDPEVMQGMEDIFSSLDDREDSDTWEERAGTLKRCLDALPDGLREVCALHYFKNRKAKQIVAALTLSLATVLKRLQRARESLRECIERCLELDSGGTTDV